LIGEALLDELRLSAHPIASSEFTDNVIAEFRANDGRVGASLADTSLMLIHHIGARTGTERVTPLAYSSQPDGRLVIAASNGGSPTHPTWYHNLKAHPTLEVELGVATFTALAEEVTGAAHANLWSTAPLRRLSTPGTALRNPSKHGTSPTSRTATRSQWPNLD
jgi:deazaflavin-dependent oxidoreductase (nitroreductase family)